MSPRHVIRPEDRHIFTPADRGSRPRVSPRETTRRYMVRVGETLYRALSIISPAIIRRYLMDMARAYFKVHGNADDVKGLQRALNREATVKIQGTEDPK